MEGRSLPDTPTWSVATVLAALVAVGFIFHHSIVRLRQRLVKTRRKALLASLETIMGELMVFGLLSLLLGHWTEWVSRICIKQTSWSTHFYPCLEEAHARSANQSRSYGFCPEGLKPFVSYKSLEQLDHLLLVLVIVHVSYCFLTVAVAMFRIYSWRAWETQAESKAFQYLPSDAESSSTLEDTKSVNIKRQSTFIFQHTSHSWIQNKICFISQFWRSIDKADYMALRFGFIFNHKLHLSYDFHNYMLRSMEDEFRDIVGISVPLWGYAIICILLNVHGTNAYFWLSFIPAALIMIVSMKLNHIVTQLALEVSNENQCKGNWLKPRDELFWFGKPELLLWLIQVISFQNAFEMATLIWSLWEIETSSCFIKNRVLVVIRLTSGILFQFWCSYCTFPLYVIVTQMGSKAKKALVPEGIRESLHEWRKRAKHKHYQRITKRQDSPDASLTTASSNASLDLMEGKIDAMGNASLKDSCINMSSLCNLVAQQNEIFELPKGDKPLQVPSSSDDLYDIKYGDKNDDNEIHEACSPYMQHV